MKKQTSGDRIMDALDKEMEKSYRSRLVSFLLFPAIVGSSKPYLQLTLFLSPDKALVRSKLKPMVLASCHQEGIHL